MDNLKRHFAISDLYLISALVSYGLVAARIDRSEPNRQKFLFDNEIELPVYVSENGAVTQKNMRVEEIELYFLSDKLWFPGSYHKTLKEIRANIHGYKKDNY